MLKVVLLSALTTVSLGGRIPPAEGELEVYIVGGNDTDITKVPYQVAMYSQEILCCGGSVVSPTMIVTAAHCVKGQPTRSMYFRAGSRICDEGGIVVKAKKYWIHPEYNISPMDYDVAVVEIQKPLTLSKFIQPIKLATSEPADKAKGLVSGWGFLYESGGMSRTLQSVIVPIVDRKTCQKFMEKDNITSRMICAGEEGKDSCVGDSGGPLAVEGRLVGIVSFGIGCARKNLPGVYTNVANSEVHDFIKKHAKL